MKISPQDIAAAKRAYMGYHGAWGKGTGWEGNEEAWVSAVQEAMPRSFNLSVHGLEPLIPSFFNHLKCTQKTAKNALVLVIHMACYMKRHDETEVSIRILGKSLTPQELRTASKYLVHEGIIMIEKGVGGRVAKFVDNSLVSF